MTRRAVKTAGIIKRIASLSVTAEPKAYQSPPASPVDNWYTSAAPYLFGPDRAMKFRAVPVARSDDAPNIADKDYLRTALVKRLAADTKDVVFYFQVQVRTKADLAGKLETEIEDACTEWDEAKYPFATVATIVIPPQDFDTEAKRTKCEGLFFTPWHALAAFQPLGGINRLKLGVYQASAAYRTFPKEPAGN